MRRKNNEGLACTRELFFKDLEIPVLQRLAIGLLSVFVYYLGQMV